MKKYDVIVIGSGGGAKITSPAARMGLKVAVIERDALGGTCLNRGCIPSKMLIHPAEVAHSIAEAARFDIHISNPRFKVDFAKLINRISNTVDHDSQGIRKAYEKNPNIDFYPGTARFINNTTVRVGKDELTAPKIVIGVGTRPQIPDIEGLKDTPFMTSTEALRNTELPKKLLVIGASYIATELGFAYGMLGCEVHFFVRSRFLRREDGDISDEFNRVFPHLFATHYATPLRVEYKKGKFCLHYRLPHGVEMRESGDALLVATGVVPNTDTLDLQNTDIALNEDGYVRVDKHLKTSVDGVYALGDCIGRYFFRHSVNFEGEYLFRTAFAEPSDEPIKYPPVPHAIFTHPQVAAVGLTEEEAKAQGIDYVVGMNPYEKSAMGMALLSDHGFVKIIVERKHRRLIGAHIIGPEAANMIHLLIGLMTKNGTLDDLLGMIYIHPALPEIVRNAGRKAREALEASEEEKMEKVKGKKEKAKTR